MLVGGGWGGEVGGVEDEELEGVGEVGGGNAGVGVGEVEGEGELEGAGPRGEEVEGAGGGGRVLARLVERVVEGGDLVGADLAECKRERDLLELY